MSCLMQDFVTVLLLFCYIIIILYKYKFIFYKKGKMLWQQTQTQERMMIRKIYGRL